MRRVSVTAMVVVCAACVDQPDIRQVPASELPTHGQVGGSGNRLGFYGMSSSDGAWQFISWHDSKLGLKCALRKLYNGKTYCVPTESIIETVSSDVGDDVIRYTDETCSTAFLKRGQQSSCDDTPPMYAIQMLNPPTDECGAYNEQHIYRIGDTVEVTAGTKWYHLTEGECTVLDNATPGTHRGLSAVKISEDEFVEFTETKN